MDPQDIQSDGSGSAFRPQRADFTFFVSRMDINSDIYTSVYLTLENTKEIPFYKEEYEKAVDTVIKDIEENLKQKREKARFEASKRGREGNRERRLLCMRNLEKLKRSLMPKGAESGKRGVFGRGSRPHKRRKDANKICRSIQGDKEGRRKLAEAGGNIRRRKQLSTEKLSWTKGKRAGTAKSKLAEERKRAEGQFLLQNRS